jgi:hypothetical protein
VNALHAAPRMGSLVTARAAEQLALSLARYQACTLWYLYVQAVGAGNDDAAALLVAAAQHHAEQDTKCETMLDSIRHSAAPATDGKPSTSKRTMASTNGITSDKPLANAVRDCAEAAGWVVSIASQRNLLRAAIYGRSHAPALVDAALIPLVALHCRVVNSLRQSEGVRCAKFF